MMLRLAVLAALMATPAFAQMDSREGIALQNQILQLRQEMDQLRGGRSGGLPPPVASGRGGSAAGGELVGQLLDRVSTLEDEVRRSRGRVDVLENQNQRLRADLEKLQADTEFRFNRAPPEGAAPRAAAAAPPTPAPPPTTSTGAPAPRTPENALREGQAALGRRDFTAAEQAAREALASRTGGQVVSGHMLLGDALSGRRDFGNAAIAYNEAFNRARTGPRAPEAMIGLANAFLGLNNKREACDTLAELRTNFPALAGTMAERAAAARQRSGCR